MRQWLIAEKNSGSRPTLNWPQNTLQASNRKGLSEAGDWTDERDQGPDLSRAGDWTRHGQRPGGKLHDLQSGLYFEILTSGRSNSRKSNCCGDSWLRTKKGRLHQSTGKDETRKRKQRQNFQGVQNHSFYFIETKFCSRLINLKRRKMILNGKHQR